MPSRLTPTSIAAQALGGGRSLPADVATSIVDSAQVAAGGVRYLYRDPKEKIVPAIDALVLAGVLPARFGSTRAVGSFAERDKLRLVVGWARRTGFDSRFPNFEQHERRLAEFERGFGNYQDLVRARYDGRNTLDLVGKAARSLNQLRLIPHGMIVSEVASYLGKRRRIQAALDRTVPFVTRVYPAFEVASGLISALVPSETLVDVAGPAGVWAARVLGAIGVLGGAAGVVAMNTKDGRVRGGKVLALSGAVASGVFAVYRAVTFVADNWSPTLAGWAVAAVGGAAAAGLGLRAKSRAEASRRAEPQRRVSDAAIRETARLYGRTARPASPAMGQRRS